MRRFSIVSVSSMILLSQMAAADVVLRPHDPSAAPRPVTNAERGPGSLAPGVDAPASLLFVPFFEVDTLSPGGTTTLFAVRNTGADPVQISVMYFTPEGGGAQQEFVDLAGGQTFSRNVRDVPGLPTDPDGFARGYVVVQVGSPSPEVLTGDYLQVDVDDDFATGERMVALDDLCQEAEVRFLDFGNPTELRLLLFMVQGSDPATDPPTATITVLSEAGTQLATFDLFTDQFSPALTSADLTGTSFGTLVFDFTNSGGGAVYSESSAEGRFSVGLNGACTVP